MFSGLDGTRSGWRSGFDGGVCLPHFSRWSQCGARLEDIGEADEQVGLGASGGEGEADAGGLFPDAHGRLSGGAAGWWRTRPWRDRVRTE